MAQVFIDDRGVETAVLVREAIAPDAHEAELVDSARRLTGRLSGAEDVALVLTGPLDDRVGAALRGAFEAEIPRPPVIAFTSDGTPMARRDLVADFGIDEALTLPVDPDEVRVVLDKLLERYRIQKATGIIGRTEPIREILERIHMIAPVNSTALLTGESGTGKELVARAIHRLSPRRGKPFIAVNCAALPESLLESELFGHEKGAFTGATSLRRGMFELADTGTLFLDEIAEMPLQTQTRLLRILESRKFMRVGGDHEIEVNVRVVTATNRDLRSAVEHGQFRRDLYYRLNVLHIDLPPLRERREDIPVLVRRFVSEFSRAHDREFLGLGPEAMDILLRYDWPGNVRELRNLIESMVVLAPGSIIRPEDIPSEIRTGRGSRLLPTTAVIGPSPLTAGGEAAPQLEFIFRTLVALKVDVEDLKHEFESYKRRATELPPVSEWSGTAIEVPEPIETLETSAVVDDHAHGPEDDSRDEEHITFRAGMTMADLEREAIVATLREVGGNRRRAAERLQIGERTLYRKIKQYEIEL
jgi:DNA-binding NtrC family response regulator